jgi:hypothetical protein
MQTMGEHLCEVNPAYCDEDLPALDQKELMGDLGVPDGASSKN